MNRYGPAEVVGTITAVFAAALVHRLGAGEVFTAYVGSASEAAGYYLIMVSSEFRRYRDKHPFHITKNLLLEFGFSETLDFFVIRPLFMGLGLHYLGVGWGLIAGKLMADLVFYVPTIFIYEWRKR